MVIIRQSKARQTDRLGFGSLVRGEDGATLAELLVVLVIISLLAVTAVPIAETANQRRKEIALQETLRTVRTAIDAFHTDWSEGRLPEDTEAASDNGYPVTLAILTQGIEITLTSGDTRIRRYLRQLPRNPFVRANTSGEGWVLIGYEQTTRTGVWNGADVYDVRAVTDKEGLDGTPISEW